MTNSSNQSSEHIILFVDDEESILASLVRLFRRQGYTILTAGGGDEALQLLEKEKREVSLIVSDQRMPKLNGAAFLAEAKKIRPDALRFLLTGYSEMEAIVDAVNKGEIHRYVTKPWNDEELVMQVNFALQQYDLIMENKRLQILTGKQNRQLFDISKKLEKKVEERTYEIVNKNNELQKVNKELESGLLNTVRALAALMEMYTPHMKGHGKRVSALSVDIARKLGLSENEIVNIEIAAILHDIGTASFSNELIEKHMNNRCSREEKELYQKHPVDGQNILAFIKRLDEVGIIIRHHHERFDGNGFPDCLIGEEIPIGSRIISIADMYDRVRYRKFRRGDVYIENYIKEKKHSINYLSDDELVQQAAVYFMKKNVFTMFDPDIVKTFLVALDEKGVTPAQEKQVTIQELEPGMVLTRPIYTRIGRFVLPYKTEVDKIIIKKLKIFITNKEIADSFYIIAKPRN